MFISLNTIFSASYTVVGDSFDDVQNVVNLAGSGSVVILDNITYKGSGTDIRINKSLIIQGKSKNKFATLDARKSSRIFSVSNVQYVNFKYINFINGNPVNKVGSLFNGGAIYSNSKLYITDCNFRNNIGSNGGAIYSSSILTIDKSSFSYNKVRSYGGALYLNKATSIKNSQFVSNSAYRGAAIYSNNKLTISKSYFKSNRA